MTTFKRLRAAALTLLLLAGVSATAVVASGCDQISVGASGVVLQCGPNVGQIAGATNYKLDDTSKAALATAAAGPNGGLQVSGTPVANGDGTYAVGFTPLATPTAAPTSSTLAAGAAAGAGAPAPTFLAGAQSNIQRGSIQFGTGLAPTAGAQVVVTFPQTFSTPPAVMVTPFNAATAGLDLYVTNLSTTGVTIAVANAPAASQGVSTYRFIYTVTP